MAYAQKYTLRAYNYLAALSAAVNGIGLRNLYFSLMLTLNTWKTLEAQHGIHQHSSC